MHGTQARSLHRRNPLPSRRRGTSSLLQRSLALAAIAFATSTTALGSVGNAHADSTAENLDKYAALRLRLDEEFVAEGEGPGHAMPVHERVDSEGLVRWADASIRLGWYIGLLATEHHLQQHPDRFPGFDSALPEGVDVQEQLYYALLALERLDEVADASFPPPCTTTPALNGFFIRDDVPESILESFPGATAVESDFLDTSLTGKEMSQDQAYHVLLGLALVKKLVDADVEVQGQPLQAWAVAQAQRIGEHISGDDWLIRNPACDRQVARGEDARGFSKGVSRALSFLTDGTLEPEPDSELGDLWDQAVDPDFIFFANSNVMHMGMAVAAVGKGWEEDTMDALVGLAEVQQWWIYPMLLRTLHDDAAYCDHEEVVAAHARSMLDEFPLGGDVASTFPGPPAEHGFTTSNRFIRPLDEHYIGTSEGRRYNGLDYLMLHNVYAIASPSAWDEGTGADCDRVAPPEGTSSSSGGADSSTGTPSDSTGEFPGGTSSGVADSDDGGESSTSGPTPEGTETNTDGCSCRSGSGTGSGGALGVLGLMLGMRRRRNKPGRQTGD